MEKLFRKVSVPDRLPLRYKEHHQTNKGILWYDRDLFFDLDGLIAKPSYWEEEVRIPTEDEIRSIANRLYPAGCQSGEHEAYVKGYEKTIEIISQWYPI